MGIKLDTIRDPKLRATIEASLGVGRQPTAEVHQPAARPPLEADLHDKILDWVHKRGWLAIHSRMDRRTTTAKGVSDFIIITPWNVFFVECKQPGKKTTTEQAAFLAHVDKLRWPNAVVHSMKEFVEFIGEGE